ncbi:hypothetical protein GGH20_003266 [Coemansia sp. RSA 1937]|nr:hypothetical protein GGH20_003266 [Coemansia sp. RSA 1937]
MDGQAHTAEHRPLPLRSQDQQASITRWEELPPSLQLLVNRADHPVCKANGLEYVRNCGRVGRLPTAAWRYTPRSPVAFPFALFNIMQNPDISGWLRWSEDGTEVQFNSWPLMIGALAAQGMAATKKESVNKNFHDYGFKRLTDSRRRIPDEDGIIWFAFEHASFKRGRPDLLRNIRRRYQRWRPT